MDKLALFFSDELNVLYKDKNCFIRVVGLYEKEKFVGDIEKGEYHLLKSGAHYFRYSAFPKLLTMEETNKYRGYFEELERGDYHHITMGHNREMYLECLRNAMDVFHKLFKNASDTIEKNFIIKLLFWSQSMVEVGPINQSKIVICGNISAQEYIGLYFLSLLGGQILYINTEAELKLPKEILALSELELFPNGETIKLCDFNPGCILQGMQNRGAPAMPPMGVQKTQDAFLSQNIQRTDSVVVKIPDREGREKTNQQEKTMEEIASLASSVVLILVRDEKGEIFKSGSGIVISSKGYILTNCHVVSGGYSFSIKMEDCEEDFNTDTIIKYHNIFDLAVLKINTPCKPIPIYNRAKPLARGQHIVAIGSPLGLFNTVSDGIISGFRTIDHVNTIQFTAPTSKGSSGGALLNLFGEVVGISTAGYTEGQNMNIAVEYSTIGEFIAGFI